MKDETLTQERKISPAAVAWEILRSENAFVPANSNQQQNSVLEQLLAYRLMKKSETKK